MGYAVRQVDPAKAWNGSSTLPAARREPVVVRTGGAQQGNSPGSRAGEGGGPRADAGVGDV